MQLTEMISLVNQILDDAKATNIKNLDVSAISSITEHMVICSGNSHRHVKAIADNLLKKIKVAHLEALSVTGVEVSDWILVDIDSIIVHIMLPEIRDYYDLEGLWEHPDNTLNHYEN